MPYWSIFASIGRARIALSGPPGRNPSDWRYSWPWLIQK